MLPYKTETIFSLSQLQVLLELSVTSFVISTYILKEFQ